MLTSAGKIGFFHYMAFDGRRPVAIAALCIFEDLGYLMAASTPRSDRKRGACAGLVRSPGEREQAEQLGCAMLVSNTLYMLEHSYRNHLQRAGIRGRFTTKEVYEWITPEVTRGRHAEPAVVALPPHVGVAASALLAVRLRYR